MNTYPSTGHELGHWCTPPTTMCHEGMKTQDIDPPPLVPFVTDGEQHLQNADDNLEANPNLGQHGLVQSKAQLMQAQTNMLTAHAQAIAMQNLPAITTFTGEALKEMKTTLRSGWSCLKREEDLLSAAFMSTTSSSHEDCPAVISYAQ